MNVNLYSICLIVNALVTGWLAIHVWSKRPAAGAEPLAALLVAIFMWAFGAGMETASTSEGFMEICIRIQYLGIGTIGVLWIIFILTYTGNERWITRQYVTLLAILPFSTIVLHWTNQWHHLMYASVTLTKGQPFSVLAVTPGPWYWVHVVYTYTLLLSGLLVLCYKAFHTVHAYRMQSIITIGSVLPPFLVNIAYVSGFRPFQGADLTPFAFTLTGGIFAWAIYRYGVGDLAPIARDTLVERMPEAVLSVDSRGRIVDANPTALEWLGLDVDTAVGAQAGEVLGRFPELLPMALGQGENQLCELMLQTSPVRVLEADASRLLDRYGRSIGHLLVLRDITRRKHEEHERLEVARRLLQTQKLESLGVLAGGLAHEFNNLLMAIIGHLELVRYDLPPEGEGMRSLEEAHTAAHRCANLTSQMVAYAGQGQYYVERIDLTELIESMSGVLRSSICRHGVLELSLQAGLSKVLADRTQMELVLGSLISNASDYLGDTPGVILVSTSEQDCDSDYLSRSRIETKPLPGRYICLQVSDTGIGMDAETKERLFEPFYTTRFAGSGLGMAAVHGIVRSHHGALMLESELGHGTEIRVLLPVAPSDEEA